MPEVIAREVVVRGRVQGVFYRATCHRKAEQYDVTGWVRNEPDGSVRALFEGADEAVDAMVAWCREGPPHAAVDTVEVTERAPSGRSSFEVD